MQARQFRRLFSKQAAKIPKSYSDFLPKGQSYCTCLLYSLSNAQMLYDDMRKQGYLPTVGPSCDLPIYWRYRSHYLSIAINLTNL